MKKKNSNTKSTNSSMSLEKCYNIFLIYDENCGIKKVGVSINKLQGTDEEKLKSLCTSVDSDWETCEIINVPPTYGYTHDGMQYLILDYLKDRGVYIKNSPLCCFTPVHNNKPFFTHSETKNN